MKLYFYRLDTEYRTGESKIVYSECDVVETPKKYKAVDRFPSGICNVYVSKDEIGSIIGYSRNVVVLDEPNVERAKQLFSEQIERKIENSKAVIADLESKLSAVRSFVG